jgi:hypothetical protein
LNTPICPIPIRKGDPEEDGELDRNQAVRIRNRLTASPTPLANYLPFTFAELIEYGNDFQDAFGNDDHAAPAFETAAVA